MASGYGAYIGLSYKSDAELRAAAEAVVKEELIIYAIANEQGLSVTDEEYKKYLADFAEQNGVTEEEVLKYYTEQDIREQILIERLVEYLTDNNEFTIKIVPETQTNQGS
jgi:FKBP-type peptidyl-prolyl cis-trans isomerase (trigger factor)